MAVKGEMEETIKEEKKMEETEKRYREQEEENTEGKMMRGRSNKQRVAVI